MNNNLLEKIDGVKTKVEQFIDEIRDIFSQTNDEVEKKNRLEVFDTLLLLATYASPAELEHEFQNVLPHDQGNTVHYLCQKLREINGFCQNSLSDEHEVYQNLFAEIDFPTESKKQAVRELLSKKISELIFEKTHTNVPNLGI
ncbi:hypothetical protein OQJ18_01130 [Fluoribacter dumoffii]|uniref:Uncharacterized protein n=1 Tax=Fluoribacter dumoffii TaxID=463 RepID=A0A377GD61_9GAMM|nr:hypothetical protein [Fluoribacter dumoffii]KTC90548.1 hypothetical protein Ldum_1616 [Fluoribacter dumoffii NY 23]MCW8386228.1 hypothetical protein [Fluoribacter dumoffii]MCW8419279.1 hypothetical protein [Fluoribacter dumoffii]MCW8452846.1 hypothetical protein [Fluoribacter dumoffii]MCW8459904.1 hypothetical protein [Fluoribacter dumoffii]